MYGFKPQHARGKPVQNFADGGIVHSIKGALGMRPRTREELMAADAERVAKLREAAASVAERNKAAQPAPQQSSITGYAGMSATQRREKELGLKDGGVVPRGFKPGGLIRGPGTGTSDSIQTEKRPGTFIMPADSTQAIGPEALEELGEVDDSAVEEQGEKVPVRLSNGEFELPPEQVQALGEAVLTVMRNATHQPASGKEAPTNKGFTPHQFFSGGGTVKDKEQQRLANQTAMYVRGAQEAAANRPPEPAVPRPPVLAADPQGGQAAFGVFPQLGRNSAGAPAQTATPQADAPVPATQVEGWRTKAVMDGAAEDAQAAWDRGGAEGVAGAAGAVARGAITAVPTAIGEFAYNTVAPLASTAKGFWNGLTGGGDNAPGVAPAPAGAATANAGAGRGSINPASVNPTQPASASAPAAASAPVVVQRMAQPPQSPAFDFDNYQPAPGQGAFRNEQTGEVTRLQDGPSPTRDTRIWKEPNVLPRSDARPAAQRQEVRAPVLNPNGGVFAAMADFTNQTGDAVNAIAANKGARNDRKDALDQQRVGLDAASTFAKIEQGDRALGIDGRRADTAQDLAALQADELGLKREAAGFQTRAAAQQEQLRNTLIDPKATPEQRKQAQEYLQALAVSDKEPSPQYKSYVMPAIRNADGSTTEGGVYQENTRTGEGRWVKPQGDGQAPQALPKAGEVRNGFRFKGGNPNDQANWTKV